MASETKKLLVVDDDERLRSLLSEYLGGRGFDVVSVGTGEEALEAARRHAVDLVILDLMLPGADGFSVCRRLRATSNLPIIMLTARGDETDRIVGLELGADDYLPKPFNPRELLARVQAVLRRSLDSASKPAVLKVGPLTVDTARRVARLGEDEVDLTSTEFDLLRTLVAQAGEVVAREHLMEAARGSEFASFDRSVDVHVSHIRRKLGDDPKRPRWIKTVRGIGYFVPKEPEP
ncbi:MAG: response regulator [Myxococcales bacterium]|nr:response regulator [Myxococcales bacterium]